MAQQKGTTGQTDIQHKGETQDARPNEGDHASGQKAPQDRSKTHTPDGNWRHRGGSEQGGVEQDSGETKPTIEEVDRVIREHEHNDATGQDMEKMVEEGSAKGQEASEVVQFKKGESLWDRADRMIDAAEKGIGNKK